MLSFPAPYKGWARKMRLSANPVTDNLTEVLCKIQDFTVQRHRVLMANLAGASDPGYCPLDLPVEEFAAIMDMAVTEHTRSSRLLFCDSKNVKFGPAITCSAQPVLDSHAADLLVKNKNEYIEHQLSKLSENTLNQKIAAELLKIKQGIPNTLNAIQL